MQQQELACICTDEMTFLCARMQAAARQQAFDATAVGKATKKSVLEAKRPAPAESTRDSKQASQNAQDWLS